jgi:hypothetical protein
MKGATLPTLSEAFDHPDRVADLPLTGLIVLLAQANTVTARATAALALKQDAPAPTRPKTTELITVAEAAAITKATPRWFYSRAGQPRYSFIKRLSEHTVRVDQTALIAWLAAQ